MKIERITRTDRDTYRDSFGRHVTDLVETEYTTVYGSLKEALQYSKASPCYLQRGAETEHLFRAWDDSSKFVCLYNGEADSFADIPGAGYYVHKFILAEAED